jgi:hypothetical protein
MVAQGVDDSLCVGSGAATPSGICAPVSDAADDGSMPPATAAATSSGGKNLSGRQVVTRTGVLEIPLLAKIQEALGELVGAARNGLLALRVGVGPARGARADGSRGHGNGYGAMLRQI